MYLKSFKDFYLTEMAVIKKHRVDQAIALIQKFIEKKLGEPLYRYGGPQGICRFKKLNKAVAGYGILYFVGDNVKGPQIRFNWTAKTPEAKADIDNIESVDFWFGGYSYINGEKPTKNLHVADVSLISILRQIVGVLKNPKIKEIEFAPESQEEKQSSLVKRLGLVDDHEPTAGTASSEETDEKKPVKENFSGYVKEAIDTATKGMQQLISFMKRFKKGQTIKASSLRTEVNSNNGIKAFKAFVQTKQGKEYFRVLEGDVNEPGGWSLEVKQTFKLDDEGNLPIDWNMPELKDIHVGRIGIGAGDAEAQQDADAAKMDEALKQLKPEYLQELLDGKLNSLIDLSPESNSHVGLLVRGTPGTGKSWTLNDVFSKNSLKEIGTNDSDEDKGDYKIIGGKISAAKLFENMWKYRDRILVFDDCNGVLLDEEAIELLKNALQTNPKQRKPTWTTRRPDIFQGNELAWNELEAEVKNQYIAPTSFLFKGKMVFITNLKPEELDSAFKDRCDFLDVRMTGRQVFDLSRKIVATLGNDCLVGVPVGLKKKVIDFFETMYENSLDTFDHSISLRTIVVKGIKTAASGSKNWKARVASALNRPDVLLKIQQGEIKEEAL